MSLCSLLALNSKSCGCLSSAGITNYHTWPLSNRQSLGSNKILGRLRWGWGVERWGDEEMGALEPRKLRPSSAIQSFCLQEDEAEGGASIVNM